MTTIVYTEEIMTTKSPNSSPKNIQKFTVKIMEGGSSSKGGGINSGQKAGSPKPQKRFSVKHPRKDSKSKAQLEVHSHFPGYNPHMFTITAYLPYDGGRRLKLQCTPGMTVQQVIETEIPDISRTGYQVYQFPSRALLNPEKDASVLQDQEISIEPMRLRSPDEVDDERLSIARELLRTEDAYLENLRNIFDIYMEPLRKWGLPQSEMNTLFRSLSRLCDLLMNFFSELELAVQYWNTNTTLIGGLFKQYPSFWDMYEEFAQSYTKACRLLKEKRMLDESFNKFLELKRGAAMHTLESLMLLPVQRIYEYHRLLVQLYSITPKDHPDYHDLRYTVACVSTMVQAREQQLNQSQNEAKLEQVQLRFTGDNLYLLEPLDTMELLSRRVNKGYTNSPVVSRSQLQSKKLGMPGLDLPDNADLGKRTVRLYLQEGPVKIITGLQSHERYFFLFDDLLLIAKPTGRQRSQHRSYKLKHRLRLSEMWVTDCVDEVMETTLPPHTSFVLGWPLTNCVAAFSSPEERNLWQGLLTKHITAQRQSLQPDKVSVRIVNLTKSSNNLPVWMQVHYSEQARDVLSRALDLLAIAVAETNCQLWVKFSKEEAPYPLVGHEHPFAIQTQHNRQQVDNAGESKQPSQLQFVIKRRSSLHPDPQQSPQQPPRARRSFNIVAWYQKKRQGRDGASSRGKKHRVFGAPLSNIIVNGQLPEILQEILIRLYSDGPMTLGIFRQSANHRKVKEFKEAIDNRQRVDLSEVSIHVVGALLKDILRSVPGGVLMSTRYTEFVATNDIKDVPTRVHQIQKILGKLPEEHQIFLQYLLPLLHYISTKEEINCMNSINLAICFAPSILWPDSGLDVIKNEVPPLVQFMIEHCPQIFGTDLPELYKQAKPPSSPQVEKMEVQYVPTKQEDGSHYYSRHKRTDSMDTSTSEESAVEEEAPSNLRRARLSGLTVSDSQLSQLSQQIDDYPTTRNRGKVELGGRYIAEQMEMEDLTPTMGQVPSPKRQKRVRKPERSHSYRAPNEKPPSQRMRHKSIGEHAGRRKSIATQTTTPRKLVPYVPSFASIPHSPNSSSSSQGYSPQVQPRRIDEKDEAPYQYQRGDLPPRRHSQKKRKAPQHSHSFSKSSENKPSKPLPTSASTSFYDKLLPLDHDAKTKSRSLGNTQVVSQTNGPHPTDEEESIVANMTWPADHIHEREVHEAMGKMVRPPHGLSSTQSITSSRSASSSGSHPYLHQHMLSSHRPSNLSLTSSHSGGSAGSIVNRESPDLFSDMQPFQKADRDLVKMEISKRFGISSMDWSKGTPPPEAHGPYGHAGFKTSTPYGGYRSHESEYMRIKPRKQQAAFPPEEVSYGSIQKKFQERKRFDSTGSESHFSKSHSYHGFLAAHRRKEDHLSIVMESPGFDDRPESEQHLNSLPRLRTAEFVRPDPAIGPRVQPYVQPEVVQVATMSEEHDPNKLYPGYNSDTESSPSRTLSRPEKMKEVSSPPGKSMPPRYRTHSGYPTSVDPRSHYQHLSGKGIVASSNKQPRMQKQHSEPERKSPLHIPEETPHYREVVQEERVTSVTKQKSFSKLINVAQKRSEEVTEKVDEETPKQTTPVSIRQNAREGKKDEKHIKTLGTTGDVEQAKVMLGLIPRQRSKSTSESEAMRIIHKIVSEEDEEDSLQRYMRRPTADKERAEKHKEWLSYAPSSTERRKAWEQLSRNLAKTQKREHRSRSLRNDSPVLPHKVLPPSEPLAEQKRKSATMPEYLNSRAGSRRLGKGMIRTVKVIAYELPEPQRIRRINLRSYYN